MAPPGQEERDGDAEADDEVERVEEDERVILLYHEEEDQHYVDYLQIIGRICIYMT